MSLSDIEFKCYISCRENETHSARFCSMTVSQIFLSTIRWLYSRNYGQWIFRQFKSISSRKNRFSVTTLKLLRRLHRGGTWTTGRRKG